MRIQHNIMAMNAYNKYTNNVNAMKKNLEKLSSGYKINRAGDDAAGLAISEKMRAQITGLETAQKNAKDGISLVQTAEGALTEVHDMLNRMVTLATQSANGTYDNDVDRVQLQKELDQLRTEINRIADSTNFNGIKLFDGSLSGADITTEGITTTQIDMAKGVDVVQGGNGGGSKGTFTISLDSAFGTGDKLEISFGGNLSTKSSTGLFGTTGGTAELTFGTTTGFEGNTIEEQAKSIGKLLKADGNIGADFDVVVDGNSITLTAKVEGNKLSGAAGDTDITSTVTGVKVTDTVTPDNTISAAATAAKDGCSASTTLSLPKVLDDGSGGGMDITDGDEIELELKLSDGTALKVSVVAGKDFAVGKTTQDTLTNLSTALNNASFTDDSDTVIDESKLKLSDVASVAANGNVNLQLTGADGSLSWAAAGDVKITNKRSNISVSNTAAGTAPASPAKSKFSFTMGTAASGTASTNLSVGDQVTLAGKLGDGRTFEFTVEVGKDFKAGTALQGASGTLDNLKNLLESDNFTIELSDGTKVAGSDIFGASAEISVTNTGDFESVREGTVTATQMTSIKVTPGEATSVSANLKNGDQKSSADSTITFNEGVSYGATVEVDGKKYEIVKSAGDVSNGQNQAVVVDDISDVNSVAKALANAVKGNLNSATYKVSVSNNKVTIGTVKVGSDTTAISASSSGDKTTQLEFTLDPKKMQSGTTVTINGQTYEFTKDGKTSDSKNIGIQVSNFAKESASSLGSALAKVANGQNNASVTVDENGKVTVRGLLDSDNNIVTPTAKFDGGTSGLTLQIGETADDFNKMRVSIYNMHVADMGVGDISILDQDSAGAAIDKIRSAINYVSDVRGSLGATQNRLDHTINNLAAMQENIQDAESTIRDTDIAAEMMEYTKNNILIQSSQAMLAQANQVPQGVLQLLQ